MSGVRHVPHATTRCGQFRSATSPDVRHDGVVTSTTRLLRLLALLPGRPVWTGAELAERLGVTGRTVRRDVTRLRELGYPVQAEPGTGRRVPVAPRRGAAAAGARRRRGGGRHPRPPLGRRRLGARVRGGRRERPGQAAAGPAHRAGGPGARRRRGHRPPARPGARPVRHRGAARAGAGLPAPHRRADRVHHRPRHRDRPRGRAAADRARREALVPGRSRRRPGGLAHLPDGPGRDRDRTPAGGSATTTRPTRWTWWPTRRRWARTSCAPWCGSRSRPRWRAGTCHAPSAGCWTTPTRPATAPAACWSSAGRRPGGWPGYLAGLPVGWEVLEPPEVRAAVVELGAAIAARHG